jgi:signal transduction histidine kinase
VTVRLGHRFTKLAFRPHLPRRTVRLRLTLLYGGLFLASGAGLLSITYVFVDHRISGPFRTGGPLPQPAAHPGTAGGIGIVHSPTTDSVQAQHSADLHRLLVGSGIALAIMAVAAIVLGWIVAGRVLRPLRTMTLTTRQISEENLHERLALSGPSDEIKDLGDTIDGLLTRLEDAFGAQRRFVANASHELRTPLTLGRAMLQVALADPALTLDSLRTTCEDVLKAGKEQEHLIEALLTLARSQRGLDHREPFDLAAIAKEVLQCREPEAIARGVDVEASLTAAPALGDARLVERLVSNLVENALCHNDPNGRVDVLVGPGARQATLRVTNTGPRIPASEIERLMQPFQRLDAERGGEHDGLGLGLSIVAAIARSHSATLNARPGTDGGLDIEVSFPARQQQDHLLTTAG